MGMPYTSLSDTATATSSSSPHPSLEVDDRIETGELVVVEGWSQDEVVCNEISRDDKNNSNDESNCMDETLFLLHTHKKQLDLSMNDTFPQAPPPPLSNKDNEQELAVVSHNTSSSSSRQTSSSSPTSIIFSKYNITTIQQQQQQQQKKHNNDNKVNSTYTAALPPIQLDGTDYNDNDDDDVLATKSSSSSSSSSPPSSEYVLNVAFYSFVGFMIIQGMVAYFYAHSSAMMADCEAMSIDALTYLFNLFAEQQKNRTSSSSSSSSSSSLFIIQYSSSNDHDHRHYRNMTQLVKLYYEFLPPTISVVTLIAVTIYTIQTSIITILNTTTTISSVTGTATTDDITTTTTTGDDDVSIPIMFTFSFLNLVLDIVNVTCFARSGFISTPTVSDNKKIMNTKNNSNPKWTTNNQPCCNNNNNNNMLETSALLEPDRETLDSFDQMECATTLPPKNTSTGVNLNMCSAWTHVCADTMRSTAVLLAAGIAFCIPTSNHMDEQYYAVMADSIAALVVSLIILLSIIPLLQGIYHTGQQIILIHWENHHPTKNLHSCGSNQFTSYQTMTV